MKVTKKINLPIVAGIACAIIALSLAVRKVLIVKEIVYENY